MSQHVPSRPGVPQVVRMRQRRAQRDDRHNGWKWGWFISTILSLSLVLGGTILPVLLSTFTAGLPSLDILPQLLDPPNAQLLQPTRLYDRSGEHILIELQNPLAGARKFIPLSTPTNNGETIPLVLVNTTLAASDPTFWQNNGYSMDGLWDNLHPTLAQHLVSNLLLWNETPGLRKAIRERLLAAQATSRFGRQKILTWYLNYADFGNLLYGAEAAARVYFNKPVSDLTLVEAAVLSQVAEAPSLNPIDAPQIARQRAYALIAQMAQRGLVKATVAAEAIQAPLNFTQFVIPVTTQAPIFTNLALDHLGQTIDRDRLQRGGLRIITSLDYSLQMQLACTTEAQMARLRGVPEKGTAADGSPCLAANLLPTLAGTLNSAEQSPQIEVAIMDVHNAQVLGLVTSGEADTTHLADHPAGTSLTPFIYLTAFTRGLGPASLVWDIPDPHPQLSLPNLDGSYHGPVRLRLALANDYFSPALQTLNQVGADDVARTARQLGLTSLSSSTSYTSVQLLSQTRVSLLELTHSYAIFANQGIQVRRQFKANDTDQPIPPTLILSIQDNNGASWPEPYNQPAQERPIISSQLAYLLNNILSDEAARWSSLGHPNALEIGRPAAAHLGRVFGENGIWAIGYTPQIVTGVWTEIPHPSTDHDLTGKVAAGIWHAMMQYAHQNLLATGWQTPAGISEVEVCDPSGLLPTRDCPTQVKEVFLAGNEPTQSDNLFRRLQINRETGLLATVFTPPELLDEHVYMMVPQEDMEWAKQAGLPLPPSNYDVILPIQSTTPGVEITAPAMNAYIKGKVTILGSAGGSGFTSYRLQAGQGVNTSEWLLVGPEKNQIVNNGALGEWDTTSLDGLYALQLVVFRQNQQVDTAIIQVTVDNQPPKTAITYPAPDQVFVRSQQKIITLQADVQDNIGIRNVTFYVDGQILANMMQAPYAYPWPAQAGTHTLLVKATDLAGNPNQTQLQFRVTP